jgi:hypothetical protein
VIAYQAAAWHDLFGMAGGASAALAGLLFVAVALNHEQILQLSSLPPLAAQSMSVLIGLVVLCLLGLVPGQSSAALGAEVLVLCAGVGAVVLVPTIRGLPRLDHVSWKIRRLAAGVLPTAPMLLTAISLMVGFGGGLFWALGTIIAGLVTATYNAWVLLIEIRR